MRSFISPPYQVILGRGRGRVSSVSHHPFLMHIPASLFSNGCWPCPLTASTYIWVSCGTGASPQDRGNFPGVYTQSQVLLSASSSCPWQCSQSFVTFCSSFPPKQMCEVGTCHRFTCCRHLRILWVVLQPHSLDKLKGRGWGNSPPPWSPTRSEKKSEHPPLGW